MAIKTVRMHPTPERIKDDLDTVFVAVDRLRVLGYGMRYGGQRGDFLLARRALIALENIRERIEYSVPVEQGEMEMGS